jgi:hypothetical protein
LPCDRRLHVVGSELLASIIDDFYVQSNEMTLDMLDHIRDGRPRLSLCFDLMVAVAHRLGMHLSQGFISFRSHGEAHLLMSPNPVAERARFDAMYNARRDAVKARIDLVTRALDEDRDEPRFVLAFTNLMRRLWDRAWPLIEGGDLDMLPGFEDRDYRYGTALRANFEHSDFHQLLGSDNTLRRTLYESTWFQAYRLMLNLLYLHMNRLGVRPIDRYVLCHLIASAVEETLGTSATEILRSYQDFQSREGA